MRTSRLTLILLAALAACHQTSPTSTRAAALLDADRYEHFGDGVHLGDIVDVVEVTRAPERYDGKSLRVRGPIESVCKQAGCWTRVGTGEPNLFVKMQGHAFFLPKDCEGRQAVVEGELAIKLTSIAEQQHYLEDAGKDEEAKKVTVPKREVTLVASGVALAKAQ